MSDRARARRSLLLLAMLGSSPLAACGAGGASGGRGGEGGPRAEDPPAAEPAARPDLAEAGEPETGTTTNTSSPASTAASSAPAAPLDPAALAAALVSPAPPPGSRFGPFSLPGGSRGLPWVRLAGSQALPAGVFAEAHFIASEDVVFWGWSEDGARFAFETWMPGEGGADCDMRYELYVVDVAGDRYADGGHLTGTHSSPEGGPNGCDPPDLGAAVAPKREAHLSKFGILVGLGAKPIEFEKKDAENYEIRLPESPARSLGVHFRVASDGRDAAFDSPDGGAAYELRLSPDGGAPWTVEAGTRRRPMVWDYSLLPGRAFLSPDGRNLALLLARAHVAYEGDRLGWMANGVRLPPRP
jgi:hypothetical protein